MSSQTFRLNESLDILSRTPKVLRTLLAGLPDDWIYCNEGPKTWSAFDVLSHLVHGEKEDWVPRIHTIVQHGTKKEFEPFDPWAHVEMHKHKPFTELLDEFESIRSENIQTTQSLIRSDEDLTRTGKHPKLGVVTLQQLVSTWSVHDLNHIGQISRVMSKHYQDEVGPFHGNLGILQK